MAHEITATDSAMFALTPAWHGLGAVVAEAPNSAEALRVAKLDWAVLQKGLQTADGESVESHKLNYRSDNGAWLGVVGADYKIVQNADAFAFLDELNQDGIVKYESAFSIRGGRVVIVTARMPGEWTVTNGDAVRRYVMISTAHDGSRALEILPTNVRVVCANTWRAALARGQSETFKLRHTGDVHAKARAAVGIIEAAHKRLDGDLNQARRLAATPMNLSAFMAFLDEIMPRPETDSETVKRHADEKRQAVLDLFRIHPLQQLRGVEGTAWAAFNAVSHFVDHEATYRAGVANTKAESRFQATTFGTGAELKARAWEVLTK